MSEKTDSKHNEISVTEAAEWLGVTSRTVRRWCDLGLLRYRRLSPLPRSPRRIDARSVAELKEQRKP